MAARATTREAEPMIFSMNGVPACAGASMSHRLSSTRSKNQTSEIADRGRSTLAWSSSRSSCLPVRTSRLTATCVHVNPGTEPLSCLLRPITHTIRPAAKVPVGKREVPNKHLPAERNYIENHPRPKTRDLFATSPGLMLPQALTQKRTWAICSVLEKQYRAELADLP